MRFRPSVAARVTALALGIFAAALPLKPGPAQAQGLFDTLFGILGGRGWLPREEEPAGGPYQAYCVRLCDGRFFPLPAADRRDRDREHERFFRYRDDARTSTANNAPQVSPETLCKAMCPATPVKVFSGTQIDRAVAGDGASYSKLQNAFVYREKMIAECTCNGLDNMGVANLDAESDPTLRPGDIVVTSSGPKVYRGASRGQPASASFVPVKEYRGMSETMRRNLSEMRITHTQEPVTARTSIPPAAAGAVPPSEDIMTRGFIP